MSSLGTIGSRLDLNSKMLREFDNALIAFKKHEADIEKKKSAETLLKVIEPICQKAEGALSPSFQLNDWSVANILKQRQANWTPYKEKIQSVKTKLSSGNFELTRDDFGVLEDIADAMDTECELLMKRMRERG